jgi:hypothetical protein
MKRIPNRFDTLQNGWEQPKHGRLALGSRGIVANQSYYGIRSRDVRRDPSSTEYCIGNLKHTPEQASIAALKITKLQQSRHVLPGPFSERCVSRRCDG